MAAVFQIQLLIRCSGSHARNHILIDQSLAELNRGQGTLLEWKGTAGQNEPATARCFVGVLEGHSIALLGIGYQKDVLSRDSDLRGMFTSFTFGQGQLDSTLVGTWELVSTMAITNQSVWESDWSRARFGNAVSCTPVPHALALLPVFFCFPGVRRASGLDLDGVGPATSIH